MSTCSGSSNPRRWRTSTLVLVSEGGRFAGSERSEIYRAASEAELLKELREFLAAPENAVWIAVVDGVVAGYLALKSSTVPETTFCHARQEAFIEDLAVAEQFRRRGVGRALVAAAEQYAADHGCDLLRLFVLASNAAAREFYETLSFAPRFEAWHKRLR